MVRERDVFIIEVGGKGDLVLNIVRQDQRFRLLVRRKTRRIGNEQGPAPTPADGLLEEVERVGLTVDATKLLPATRGYYTFTGSLTTPPCTESVTWFVLKTPSQISRDEIGLFAQHYPHNARPLQAANHRTIVMSP